MNKNEIDNKKLQLAVDIGNWYGEYLGGFRINNGERVYEYKTVDALLIDWLDTLVEESLADGRNWNDEMEFIVNHCDVHLKNIIPYKKKDGSYNYSVLVNPKNPEKKNDTRQLSAGTCTTLLGALRKRKVAWSLVGQYNIGLINPHNPEAITFDVLAQKLKELSYSGDGKNKFRVKTPIGYLMVEEKGIEEEYPGVFISFSKDGKEYDVNNIIACVEYDTCSEEIKTETYRKGFEEPTHIVCYEDGRDML